MDSLCVKIFGERNTGTNHLSKLIRKNFPGLAVNNGTDPRGKSKLVLWRRKLLRRYVPGGRGHDIVERDIDRHFEAHRSELLAWKHACLGEEVIAGLPDCPRYHYVALVKNPYSWLLSLHRRPYHGQRRPESFEAFLRTPWPTVGREHRPGGFAGPVQMWNEKTRGYLLLGQRRSTTILRYEDLVAAPAAAMARIAADAGLPFDEARFEDNTSSTKDRDKDSAWYRDYYMNERWREKLTERAVALIDAELDHELARRLAYAPGGNGRRADISAEPGLSA